VVEVVEFERVEEDFRFECSKPSKVLDGEDESLAYCIH